MKRWWPPPGVIALRHLPPDVRRRVLRLVNRQETWNEKLIAVILVAVPILLVSGYLAYRLRQGHYDQPGDWVYLLPWVAGALAYGCWLPTYFSRKWSPRLIKALRELGYCVACGYNLAGNESGICPECGEAAPPTDPSQLAFLGLASRPTFEATFTGSDAGKNAHYMLRWINRKGEKGPWSETISATVTA